MSYPVGQNQGFLSGANGASYPDEICTFCTLEVQSTKSTMGLTPTPQNEILTFAISFCETFWGAPTSSVTIANNLNNRLFYYTTNLCKWQHYTKIIIDTYLLTLMNVNRNPDKEVVYMSFKEQSLTTYLLTQMNVDRNQEEVISTTTTTKMHARLCRQTTNDQSNVV